jgi:hypothetical protein
MANDQIRQKAEGIVSRLLETAGNIRYGTAGVEFKIHNGRIVDVTHTVTESMRESGLLETPSSYPSA